MSVTLDELKRQCAGLNAGERVDLANFLLDSIDEANEAEVEAAWRAEVRRRVAEIRAGRVVGIPAAEVFAAVREKYS